MCEFCKTDEDGYAENGDKSITLGKLGSLHATLDFITEENKKSYLYIGFDSQCYSKENVPTVQDDSNSLLFPNLVM